MHLRNYNGFGNSKATWFQATKRTNYWTRGSTKCLRSLGLEPNQRRQYPVVGAATTTDSYSTQRRHAATPPSVRWTTIKKPCTRRRRLSSKQNSGIRTLARNSTNNAPIGMLPTRSNTIEHTPERWPAECKGGRDARREADAGRGCRGHAAVRDGCRTRRHRRVLPNARQRRRSNVW